MVDVLGQYKPTQYKRENKSMGVMIHGEDNLRSLVNENLVEKSPTASYCSGLYAKFIKGAGFEGGDINISDKPHKIFTPNMLLSQCVEDDKIHEGSFVHVRYNALYQKVGFQKIPFTQCRFGLEDDNEYSGRIVRAKKGWGKRAKKDSFEVYNIYNPNPEVIQKQVEDAGGWEYYKGQIMFIGEDTDNTYPRSRIEGVENFAHTENKMGVYYASTVERGFENVQLFEYIVSDNKKANEDLKKGVLDAMGLDGAGAVISLPHANVTDLKDSNKYKFTPVQNNATPEKYEHFLDTSSRMIRSKWEIPTQLFEAVSGKLGNSTGEDLKVSNSMYNQTTAPKRQIYSNSFEELFKNFKTDLKVNWDIKQFSIVSEDGTIKEENERPIN